MGALVSLAAGLLVGAWIAVAGLRLPHAWIACALPLGEVPRRLDDQVDPFFVPVVGARLGVRGERETEVADAHRAVERLDLLGEGAVDAVVSQEGGDQIGPGDVVDRAESRSVDELEDA